LNFDLGVREGCLDDSKCHGDAESQAMYVDFDFEGDLRVQMKDSSGNAVTDLQSQ